MRVKCLAQEHNTMTRPGLEPGPLDTESSALTTRPPRLSQVHFAQLLISCEDLYQGESCFPYILLNKIETMFSQLAKQSHWELSADCSIAHELIRPVDLLVNTFSDGN